MANLSELMHKKVAGIPVVYLGGAAALVLAIIAYRTRNNNPPTPTATDASATDVNADGTAASTTDPYSGLDTNGTVVVQPQAPAAEDATQATNDQWLRSAVADVAAAKIATVGDAQSALSKYLAGDQLSYDEGAIRDYALSKDGLPPEPLTTVGAVSSKAGRKQVTTFPGVHVVEGPNDNTFSKIASLEYGNADALHVNSLASWNSKYGGANATLNVGTRVTCPVYVTPKYYTAVKGYQTDSQIASKNGTNAINIQQLNPGMVFPVAIGTKVRVL